MRMGIWDERSRMKSALLFIPVRWFKSLFVFCVLILVIGTFFSDSSGSYFKEFRISLRQYSANTFSSRLLSLRTRSPKRQVYDVQCDKIIKGDKDEIARAKQIMDANNFTRKSVSDNMYINLTKDCNNFKRTRYPPYKLSAEEEGYSVAYSILLYKDVEQTERLLRAIYSPVNYYCLHVDADANKEVHDAVDGIASCFDNVFVVSRKEYVVYAGFTRLQADLTCMENLLRRAQEWRYLINLPSQEFPLKTNAEIAKILRIYNGANDIEGLTGNRMLPERFKNRFVYKHINNDIKASAIKTNQSKEELPYNISIVKGSAYGIFSRDFVHFVTYNRKAREILDWFRDVLSPDEYYWATLTYNPHIGTPGSYYRGKLLDWFRDVLSPDEYYWATLTYKPHIGTPGSYYIGKPDDKPWFAVYAAWGAPCHGKLVRGVCIFGVEDLHLIVKLPHLFANKFFIDYQPYAFDCIEEWHFNRSSKGIQDLNVTFYESLPFINREKRK